MMSWRAALLVRSLAKTPALQRPAVVSASVVEFSPPSSIRCFSSILSSVTSPTPLRSTRSAASSRASLGSVAATARPFSSEDDGESASTELSSLLSRELEEEESTGSAEMPDELSELLTKIEEEWRVMDGGSALGGEGGSGTVNLFKKSSVRGGAKVGITFHCQDTIADESADDGFGAVEEDDEEEEESVAVRFTATVTRAGKSMVLSCVSENADATVEGVAIVNGDADSVSKGVDESLYQGPEFSELADDLQESFTVYLQEDLGIDGDVAAFIAMYADYREQMEYVGWLKVVQSMIQ